MSLKYPTKYLPVSGHLIKWTITCIPLSLATGSLVAFFLWSLDHITGFRQEHAWLLFLLPLAGIVIHYLYRAWGRDAERGNNLVIDEIHNPGGGITWRMAPLVLATTLITHMSGGSAGREGTAVQMGGSIASLLNKRLRLSGEDTRILLMSGIAAGFGAVFGTPVAGAVFALEVPISGRANYKALLPCFISALLSDIVCKAWGIHHTAYHIAWDSMPDLTFNYLLLFKVIIAGMLFGIVARSFAWLSHMAQNTFNKYIKVKWLIPVTGGIIIISLTLILGTYDYLGLGVSAAHEDAVTIVSCFKAGGADQLSWLWKLVFTVITLASGFKGGEVTPLFFIGAALGNTLATAGGAPTDLMAGLGLIAVFAGATNTPLASMLMGVELFGGTGILYYAAACFTAYYFSGPRGIYKAQQSDFSKGL